MLVRKRKPPLKIFGEVDTVIVTKTKFLESKFFEVENKIKILTCCQAPQLQLQVWLRLIKASTCVHY